MDLIIKLLDSLAPYGHYGYIFMFLMLIACGFGLPMPEDVILITGGILAGRNVVSFWGTVCVTMMGVMIGDGIVFTIGRRFGHKIRDTRFFRMILPKSREAKVQEWFSRYGDKVVFFARFAPGLRAPLFLTAGTYGVPYWKFFILDGFAATISVPLWIWIGEFFGDNLDTLEHEIRKFQFGIYAVIGILLTIFFGYYFWKSKKGGI